MASSLWIKGNMNHTQGGPRQLFEYDSVPDRHSTEDFSSEEKRQIRGELARLLESDVFVDAERLRRFLVFVVSRSLEEDHPFLDQHTIAIEVFDRPTSFDPGIDPIVRVEAGRLRAKLSEYYQSVGKQDPIRIGLAKRGYSLEIERFQVDAASELPIAARSSNNGSTPRNETSPRPIGIAVLPFGDLTPDSSFGYFCEALAEQVMQALRKEAGLNVVARNSTRQFKEKPQHVRAIGVELGVETVLEGSIQKVGNALRISVLLAATDTGHYLWSQVYERSLTDVFATEDDVSQKIARDLDEVLSESRDPNE